MSEKKTIISYDVTKNMDCEINPAFISGLQQIYYRYITEFYDDVGNFAELIKDFNLLVTNPKEAKAKNRIFTSVESDIYTLYSLITLLKGFAVEQGLERTEETAVDKEAFKTAADKAMKDSSNPIEILNNLTKNLGELS
jgi:hypothetical protein